MENSDYILCECDLDVLENLVTVLEPAYQITIARAPQICLTMVKAEDSVEHQAFYLGEVLTTDCEVIVNGYTGYGLVIGDEPVRSYCIAFLDALIRLCGGAIPVVAQFLEAQASLIELRQKTEYNQILRSKVDFKLMEQD